MFFTFFNYGWLKNPWYKLCKKIVGFWKTNQTNNLAMNEM
jgi:hypothetical protein